MALSVFRSSVPTWTAASKNAVPPLKSPALHRRSPSRANSRQEASILNMKGSINRWREKNDTAAPHSSWMCLVDVPFVLLYVHHCLVLTEWCHFELRIYLNTIKSTSARHYSSWNYYSSSRAETFQSIKIRKSILIKSAKRRWSSKDYPKDIFRLENR